jgi:hypothetical protein
VIAAGDLRGARLSSILAWAAPQSSDEAPLGESHLRTPIALAGPPGTQSVPLHDAFLLRAYAIGCLDRAGRMLPTASPEGERERAYYYQTLGRLELSRRRLPEAAIAFRNAPSAASLADLCENLPSGDITAVMVRTIDSRDARALADLVAALLVNGFADWSVLAPTVSAAVDRWEEDAAERSDTTETFRLRWGHWAAAAAWLRAGDAERSARHAFVAYDAARHGDLRANPALWLPELVRAAMGDLNQQTLVLRAVSETAAFAPCFWGVYDALQGYYVHHFVDSPQSIRR